MNERIKKLMEQASEYAHENRAGDWEVGPAYQDIFHKKFAELFVAECIGVVNKTDPPGYEDYPDYRDQIEKSFRRECAIEIKKHFGVMNERTN